MSEFLSNIGNFLSNANDMKSVTSLLGLAGTGANIYSGIQNTEANNQALGAQKYVTSLMENPAKMTAAAAQYAQPLSAGLTSDISNQVQANLAERGLGSSPSAYTQQLTQALAPYIQQNQQTAMQQLLQTLGLAPKPTATPMMDMSKLLASLKLPSGNSNPPSSGAGLTPDYASTSDDFSNPDLGDVGTIVPFY